MDTSKHAWDGNESSPTFHPSLVISKDDGTELWHGWVIDGRMSTDLEALKKLASREALKFFEDAGG